MPNLDDIPAHPKNYNNLLKQWAARISGTGGSLSSLDFWDEIRHTQEGISQP